MAAAQNGQIEIVKLLIKMKYRPTNPILFEESKLHCDDQGNTVLHIAYKVVQPEIAKLIIETGLYKDIAEKGRNNRGQLPTQINHRKLYDDEFEIDQEPDYCFIVKDSRFGFLKS